MNPSELTEAEQQFLIEVFKKTSGSTSSKVSMFDIGAALGKDKTESSRAAEVLIGWELVEVKTLSGAIGITTAGIELVQQMGAAGGIGQVGGVIQLGKDPVLTDSIRKNIEGLLGDFKSRTSSLKLDFDAISEWMADIKTIEMQLTSSKPKTAVIRECFRSMKGVIERTGDAGALKNITSVLGE